MPLLKGLLVIVLAYLLGSIPFAYILVKKKTGKDIRHQGSGNVGTTNASRVLGKKWAIIVLLLDYSKGFLSAWIGMWLGGSTFAVLGGAFAIIGHSFPVWLHFKGGKGMATGFGIITVLVPQATFFAVLIWLVVLLITRYVSLASILTCVAMIPLTILGDYATIIKVVITILACLIVYLHRSNLKRILAGTEPKFGNRV